MNDIIEKFNLKNIEVTKDFLLEINKNKKFNDIFFEYYNLLYQETNLIKLLGNASRLKECNSYFLLDYYEKQKIKDFKKTNLCRDKFCSNCKKVKQANRLLKFQPYLYENLKNGFYNYHIVFTVPNVCGSELSKTIKRLFKSFRMVTKYLDLNEKSIFYNFEQFGYLGCIRSLEVTYSGDNYHPHIHSIFTFKSKLDDTKKYINIYSSSKKNGFRLFTDFEILIQKMFYIFYNNMSFTEKNYINLELGYSCTVDYASDDAVYEIFKYMTKSTSEDKNIMTYDNFKTLYFSLHNVRQIQGYGIYYNFKDDDKISNEVDEIYNYIIECLRKIENPQFIIEELEALIKDTGNILISRKKIFNILKNLK